MQTERRSPERCKIKDAVLIDAEIKAVVLCTVQANDSYFCAASH